MAFPNIVKQRLHAACGEAGFGLSFQLPGGVIHHFGRGDPVATVVAKDGRGVAALRSMDVVRIGEAYLCDSIDIVGDICRRRRGPRGGRDRSFGSCLSAARATAR